MDSQEDVPFSGHYVSKFHLWTYVFWVILVYFNIRNNFPKYGTFILGHPVHIYICMYVCMDGSTMYECKYVNMKVCTNVSICVCMYIRLNLRKNVCMYEFM